MTTWTNEELSRIGEAQELQLASERPDGTMRPYVTMWVVRAGDNLYVRSAYGANNPWFRRATASGDGRIRAGGLERDVTFAKPGPDVHGAIDAAYHAKYDRYGPKIVGTVVGPEAEVRHNQARAALNGSHVTVLWPDRLLLGWTGMRGGRFPVILATFPVIQPHPALLERAFAGRPMGEEER
jgi:hypothetical protein